MAARNDQILLNNGSRIYISTFEYGVGTDFGHMAKGTNHPPSVLDLSRYDLILVSKAILDQSVINDVGNPHNEEQFHSDTFQANKQLFEDNVVWLWGSSLDTGGVCIYKTPTSGKVKLRGFSGLAYSESGDVKYYQYVASGETPELTLSDLTDACFMYMGNESNLGSTHPQVYLFTCCDMRSYPNPPTGGFNTYWSYYQYQAAGVYLQHDMYDMYDPTRFITWEGTLGQYPTCYIHKNYDTVYPHNINMQILGYQDDKNIISGDIWGGMAADDEDDPNDDAGSSEEQGGNGDYPSETSHVDTPDASTMTTNIVNSGFVTLYNPTLAQIKSFNDFLFTDIDDALSVQLKRLWADPLDFVLFIALCHFTPPSTLDSNIMYAGLDSGVTAHKISNQFYKIDCGTIHISGDTKTFLDYNNLTKISIYLPYAGIKQLSADDIIGSDVNVTYNIDMLTGNCLITIKCVRSLRRQAGDAELDDVLYTFSANCFESIPITATDWRSLYNSIINVITGAIQVAGGVGSGNVGGVAGGIGNIANGIMSEKVAVETSGNLSSNFSYMGVQYPYIILERPMTSNPYNYRAFKGQVLNMRYKLGNLKGYTEIESDTLWIDGFDGITESEAEMLKQITASGFYL